MFLTHSGYSSVVTTAGDFRNLVPLVLMVGVVPITPSSLGVQEGAFVFLLARIGASPAGFLTS